MELNEFEISIIRAIGRHHPTILDVINELEVKSREFTGPGFYVDFFPIKEKINHHVQLLDLFGKIILPSSLSLSAHIVLKDGKPDFLEVITIPLTAWDGNYKGYVIKN